MKAGSVALLWLLSVSVCDASTAIHGARKARARRACDPQTTVQKLPRKPVSYGGPLARPSARAQIGLTDPVARLLRGSRAVLQDNLQAIQNDAPMAPIVSDPIPLLQPLGAFVDAFAPRPRSGADFPRSPRGPPTVA
jgi:hypothetical protein